MKGVRVKSVSALNCLYRVFGLEAVSKYMLPDVKSRQRILFPAKKRRRDLETHVHSNMGWGLGGGSLDSVLVCLCSL